MASPSSASTEGLSRGLAAPDYQGNLGFCSGKGSVFVSAPISRADPQKRTDADNIQADWSDEWHEPSEAELKTAAQLAHEGYMSSVKNINIVNVDISDTTSDNMGNLASIVKDGVWIDNMTPLSHLGAILASVLSTQLWLGNMSLSEENTRALVTAMRTRVHTVTLWSGVTLDPELLSAYDGQGRCTKLAVCCDTRTKYGARLRRWAGDRGWTVTADDDFLRVQRLINFWFYLQLRT